MIETQAKKVSSFFISRGIIVEADREVYDYCFEVSISAAVTLAVITGIGLAAGSLLPTLCYLAVFAVLKSTIGGYHARSHAGCLFGMVSVYTLFLFVLLLLPDRPMRTASLVLSAAAVLTVFLFAPVGTRNKPLEKAETVRLRRQSRLLVLILFALSAGLDAAGCSPKWPFTVSCAMAAAALSLPAGLLQFRRCGTGKGI